jgi:hypothetical protein
MVTWDIYMRATAGEGENATYGDVLDSAMRAWTEVDVLRRQLNESSELPAASDRTGTVRHMPNETPRFRRFQFVKHKTTGFTGKVVAVSADASEICVNPDYYPNNRAFWYPAAAFEVDK